MKKFALVVGVLALLSATFWLLRAPIAVAVLKGSPDLDVAWALLATDPGSERGRDFSRDHLIDLFERWQDGERVNLYWAPSGAIDVLRAGDGQPDAELCEALVGIYLASGDYRSGFGQSPYRLGGVIEDFAENPQVTRAIESFVVWAAAERTDVIKNDFDELVAELARRGCTDVERTATAIAEFALGDGPYSTDWPKFSEAFAALADDRVRTAAWKTALARSVTRSEHPEYDRSLRLVIDELIAASPELEDDVVKGLLASCARYSSERTLDTGMTSLSGESCLDLALRVDGLDRRMTRLAQASGDDAQVQFATMLASEVERIRTRSAEDIVRYWMAAKPSDPGQPVAARERSKGFSFGRYRPRRAFARDVELLRSADASIVPLVHEAYASQNRGVAWMSAGLLARLDPKGLAAEVIRRIDAFGELAYAFTRAGAYDHAAFYRDGARIEEGLQALAAVDGELELLYPWLRALSIPEPGFAKRSAKLLRQRMTAGQFTDALFGFLAIRPSFSVPEVRIYESTLLSYAGIGAEVERKLGELLTEKQQPESVPWILKYLGLRTLAQAGQASALELLERYAADTAAYLWQTQSEANPADFKSERRLFRELATGAAEKIRARHSQ